LTRFFLSLWLPIEQVPADIQSLLAFNRQLLETMGQETNLFSLLSSSLLGMPSYLAGGLPEGISGSPVTWGESSSALTILAIIPLLIAASLFLGSLYLGAIAQITREGTFALVMMIGGVLASLSPAMAQFVLLGAGGLVLWMLFHLSFVPHAIVVSESGLLRAVWNSLIVVGRNFWSALALVVSMNLIKAGFTVVWNRVSVNALLTAASIAGNAFIGTGLVAASLIFYRDRMEQWIAWLEQARSAGEERE
jgi:hypothetical protein